MTRIYVPADSAALAVGADEVAAALSAEARRRGSNVEIIRNGSRGLYWLEPLVEVETAQGRVGYGGGRAQRCRRACSTQISSPAARTHKALGLVEEIPYLKRQQRLTFARCGRIDPLSTEAYVAEGGMKGLARARELGPAATIEEVVASGLRGRGGAGFPTGDQMAHRRRR